MTNTYKNLLFLALIAAGLAGNHFNYQFLLDTYFIFGSIFAMLTLQMLGLGRGIVAAALIASYTYVLWNHPNAIITLTAEVAVVGWLMKRHKVGMVLADMLYWLVIGIPLAYLLYHITRQLPFGSSANFLLAKLVINGIANALVARLIYTGFVLWSRSSQTSFRDLAYNLLTFFVLCPALITLAIESRNDFNNMDSNIRKALINDSTHVQERMDTWVANRQSAIINLAELAASRTPLQMQPFLEQAKKADLNFQCVGIHNSEAIATAHFPLIEESGEQAIGRSFADRPYISPLKQTLKPMFSDVTMSKTNTPKPKVLIIAPVVIQGEYSGYAAGTLDLKQIKEYLDISLNSHDALYTLLDKNGNVIMSNRTDQTIMAPFVPGQGTLHRLDSTISRWVPVVPANNPLSARWNKSFYVTEIALAGMAKWKLILEQPVAPFQKTLSNAYASKLTRLFLIMFGALALAEVISRWSLVTLEKLRLITNHLPIKLATGNQTIVWPESGITEANHLIENFKAMADSLTEQFHKIHQINESLEQRIQKRTAQLSESEARYRSILNACPDDITITDMEGHILMFSPSGLTMFGYDQKEEVLGQVFTNFIVPEDRDRATSDLALLFQDKLKDPTEYRGLRSDGSTFDIEAKGEFIRDVDGQPVGIVFVVRDISERKRVEKMNAKLEAENRQLQKAESLGMMAGSIAHLFNNQLNVVIGNLEIALDDRPLWAGSHQALTHAMQATLRAAEISSQMLTYLGQTKGKHTLIDLAEVCRRILPWLQASAPKDLTLTSELPSPGPVIKADAEQIQQMITCLVTNAWEASEGTQGTVAITVKTISPGDISTTHCFPIGWQPQHCTYTCLEVQDTGCGIAEKDIEKLFDPFFSNKFTGRGLGLSIVLGIVKAHKGAVSVESAIGQGSLFRIFIPSVEEVV